MDSKEIQILVEKFIENSASSDEEDALMSWYRSANEQELEWLSEYAGERELTRLQMLTKINREIGHSQVRRLSWRWIAAASVLLILSTGGYFALYRDTQHVKIAKVQTHDIAPGHNQATLTLANGQKIILTKRMSGNLAKQGNMLIQINNHSALAYTGSAASDDSPIQYNTMSTAKGEQSPFPLVLADGTKVWLNAQSSITFPTTFHGNERVVKIEGEAYFEVVHNSSKPFKVQANGQTIEDIGTHFNVNAYVDEPVIKTTLIEGSVRIIKGTKTAIINPGQQAITRVGNNLITVENADSEDAIAWKSGLFSFRKSDIQAVMRQLSRWYNVDIIYEGQIPHRLFNGEIHRNLNASNVLKVLSFYKVNFRIDGQKIFVKE